MYLIADYCQEVPVLVLRRRSCHAVSDMVSVRSSSCALARTRLLEHAKIRPKLKGPGPSVFVNNHLTTRKDTETPCCNTGHTLKDIPVPLMRRQALRRTT